MEEVSQELLYRLHNTGDRLIEEGRLSCHVRIEVINGENETVSSVDDQ